ncbi:hypothetical protein [Cohnella silvisoli]|uniref:Alpha-L-rhamnosidase six-hairpin glycosidase domain-containing protein n=1 Tax=Cohnella silvisoli TaxID=2873699 RepID=A0ABV1KWI1_9BACL|nr:hypothetical protein [Cohnella silvisoli]MCD9023751.1 hypothetical protein [Cohnella silvisoli]
MNKSSGSFRKAQPIWLTGLETEKNVFAGYRAIVHGEPGERLKLRIAASSIYRCFANGKFIGHGPAAAPHGYYRIDEWELPEEIIDGDVTVAIEVAGYNVNSFYTLDQPSFVQAEVVRDDGLVLASTGAGDQAGFEAGLLSERIRKTQRYSFQRAFTEVYRLYPWYADWRKSSVAPFCTSAQWNVVEDKSLLSRGIAYPDFTLRHPEARIQQGTVTMRGQLDNYRKDRSLTGVGSTYLGYREEALETIPSLFLQEAVADVRQELHIPYDLDAALKLGEFGYQIVDFGTNLTGFVGASIACSVPTRLYFLFDEVLTDGDIDFLRLDAVNVIGYELQPGTYEIEALEPNSMRYLKLLVLKGEAQVRGLYLREYANADVDRAAFSSGNAAIDSIFRAGIETYRQNTVDVFMDCPSRERAGWLCDSFFTARTAFDVSGHTGLERFFFENYLLPSGFRNLPEGMLPMCYPADHYDGNFIPNWGLWFVVQLEEYVLRSGDAEMAQAFKTKVCALFRYFEGFRNEDGLLERLDGWIFVECTDANEWVQDVNYPTNMLYAGALSAAARLYEIAEWEKDAEQVRATVREQSFNGQFFVDNAVRIDGHLEAENHISEVCQYYAFFFGIADSASYPELFRILLEQFGPLYRGEARNYPHIPHTNQLVGNFMRMEVLSLEGCANQLLKELPAFFEHMAKTTGTLWEHDGPVASCNHGFASHVVRVLYRDLLGVSIDPVRRTIELHPGTVELNACSGTIPIGDDVIRVEWEKKDGELKLTMQIPSDYRVDIVNSTGMPLKRVIGI